MGKGTQPGHLESQEGDFGSLLLQGLWESESYPLPPPPPSGLKGCRVHAATSVRRAGGWVSQAWLH